jgi:hypothetical protein
MNFGKHNSAHNKVSEGNTDVKSNLVGTISWTRFIFCSLFVELPGGLVLRPSWMEAGCPRPGQLLELSSVWAALPCLLSGREVRFHRRHLEMFYRAIPACQQLHFLISGSFISLKASDTFD